MSSGYENTFQQFVRCCRTAVMTRHDKYNLSAFIHLFYIFLTHLFNYGDELNFCSTVMKLWFENGVSVWGLRITSHCCSVYTCCSICSQLEKQLKQLNPQRGRRLQLQPAKCLLSTKSALAPALQPSLDTRYLCIPLTTTLFIFNCKIQSHFHANC